MGDQRRSTIERALELARSGKVGSLQELRQALKREGSQDKITTLSGLQQQMPAPTAVTKHPVLKVSIITLSPCRAQANQYSCLEV